MVDIYRRTIFGGLVPYQIVWCPGADAATTLDSTRPLQVGSLAVPPGPHTIWILPTPNVWTLIVSKEPSGFHSFYPSSSDLGRIELRKQSVDLATVIASRSRRRVKRIAKIVASAVPPTVEVPKPKGK